MPMRTMEIIPKEHAIDAVSKALEKKLRDIVTSATKAEANKTKESSEGDPNKLLEKKRDQLLKQRRAPRGI